jgi:hypothetical protein
VKKQSLHEVRVDLQLSDFLWLGTDSQSISLFSAVVDQVTNIVWRDGGENDPEEVPLVLLVWLPIAWNHVDESWMLDGLRPDLGDGKLRPHGHFQIHLLCSGEELLPHADQVMEVG